MPEGVSTAVVRFRPTGPWRTGIAQGSAGRADAVYHSDSAFSAVTQAMGQLGHLDEWLDCTARRDSAPPDVRFSSFFPYQRDILYVPPPRNVWPPAASVKLRYKAVQFVPVPVVETLLKESAIDENRWLIDGESGCLIPNRDPREGPFRRVLRKGAAVDRLIPGQVQPYDTAGIEFSRDSGLWTMVVFSDSGAQERWESRVRFAFRLLADSGFGGRRSHGWGRSLEPRWDAAPEFAFDATDRAWWLLSAYLPAAGEAVDWTGGSYSLVHRAGRIESTSGWGLEKPAHEMIAEGSVLRCETEPRGEARDVAPPGFAHPVYRAGFAVAISIPWRTQS